MTITTKLLIAVATIAVVIWSVAMLAVLVDISNAMTEVNEDMTDVRGALVVEE